MQIFAYLHEEEEQEKVGVACQSSQEKTARTYFWWFPNRKMEHEDKEQDTAGK